MEEQCLWAYSSWLAQPAFSYSTQDYQPGMVPPSPGQAHPTILPGDVLTDTLQVTLTHLLGPSPSNEVAIGD